MSWARFTPVGARPPRALHYVVAIRQNHGVWMGSDERIRSARWRPFQRVFSNGAEEERYSGPI